MSMLVLANNIKQDNSFYDYHEKKLLVRKPMFQIMFQHHSYIRPAESHLVSLLLLVVIVDLVNVSALKLTPWSL